jgi:CRISPR-associated exonuclease Cas4
MFGGVVGEGALFYGTTRRRHPVVFDAALRMLTAETAAAVRANIAALRTPPPVRTPACRRCSLEVLCQPSRLERPPHVARWLAGQIAD